MKQQFEQLLKDAEEVTAKMREALAHMDKSAINMEHGKWYRVGIGTENRVSDWLLKFSHKEDNTIYSFYGYSLITKSEYKKLDKHCYINEIKSYSPATLEDMQLLPDGHPEKPKPALAVTYEEVADAVKPEWLCEVDGNINRWNSIDHYQLPTEAAAKQDRAYIQIKNLEAYCADRFEGERDYTLFVNCDMNLRYEEVDYAPFHFTREAAEWIIANHPEPFLVFFGVKS